MKKTLIVVGAGASKDYCRVFPTGAELFREVNHHFLTELKYPPVRKALGKFLSPMMNEIHRVFPGTQDTLLVQVKNLIWNLRVGYEHGEMRDKPDIIPPSVDRFISESLQKGALEARARDLMKYSIAYLIKGAETAVSQSSRGDVSSWLKHLMQGLQNIEASLINERIRIVTFNYDRTIERAFETYTKGAAFDIRTVLSHAYGSLGTLSEFPFELNNDETQLMRTAFLGIRLIAEERNMAAFNYRDFEQVHFLGFGFDRDNMLLLGLPQNGTMGGTAYGMSKDAVAEVHREFGVELRPDMGCMQYVQEILVPTLGE